MRKKLNFFLIFYLSSVFLTFFSLEIWKKLFLIPIVFHFIVLVQNFICYFLIPLFDKEEKKLLDNGKDKENHQLAIFQLQKKLVLLAIFYQVVICPSPCHKT